MALVSPKWDSLGSLLISHEPLGNSWPTSQRIRLLHSPAIQIVVSWTFTPLRKEQNKNFQVGKYPLFPPMMNVFFFPCYRFFQDSERFFPDMKRAAGVAGVSSWVRLGSRQPQRLRDPAGDTRCGRSFLSWMPGALESQGFKLLNHQSGNKMAKYLVGLTTILA